MELRRICQMKIIKSDPKDEKHWYNHLLTVVSIYVFEDDYKPNHEFFYIADTLDCR